MLTFGEPEQYRQQIGAALEQTVWFTSFVTGTEGARDDSALKEWWDERPAVYAIVYRDGFPASHPELERLTFGTYGGRVLYFGKTIDAWRRFGEHRKAVQSVCWTGGPELDNFWYYAMPVDQAWEIHSFEQLAIDLLKPIFNDVVKGLGAGGEKDFLLYLCDPAKLEGPELVERAELVTRVEAAIDDPEGRPEVWFDEKPLHEPAVAEWLEKMRRDE